MSDPFDAQGHHLIERAAWSLVWLAILTTGVDVWSEWSAWPGMAIVSPLIVLTGIVGTTVVWSVRDPTSLLVQRFGFAAASATLLVGQGVAITTRRYYSTDSAAFNHVSSQLLLDGHNPYASSLAGAAQYLHPASSFWTYTVDGGHVTSISYPAGSFLLQAPLMALGVHHLPTDWLDLAAWLAAGVLLFVLLPTRIRWLAPVLMLSAVFVGSFANGGTDALYLPFLVLAVWRWDRFATSNPQGLARWLSPVALGIACSIKQGPWFCVPFLLLGVALEARAANLGVLRTTTRYALITGAVFLAINMPFIVWSPSQWWHAVLLPLTTHFVPDGQGLVSLALHGLSGGVDLTLLSLGGALVLLTLLAAMFVWYPALKRSWLFLLPLALFVPGRSLTNYLVDFVPVALVAASSVRRASAPARTTSRTTARLFVGVPLVAGVVVAILAFGSAPLSVRIDSFTTADSLQRFASITVTVRNHSSRSLSPRFMIALDGGHPTGFWKRSLDRGSLPLAPGATATFTIRPPGWIWAPQRADYWLVDAYTSSPYALSTSTPNRWPLGPL